eukprot:scaffold4011_cov197-Ochromonas_danica.AAC.32
MHEMKEEVIYRYRRTRTLLGRCDCDLQLGQQRKSPISSSIEEIYSSDAFSFIDSLERVDITKAMSTQFWS